MVLLLGILTACTKYEYVDRYVYPTLPELPKAPEVVKVQWMFESGKYCLDEQNAKWLYVDVNAERSVSEERGVILQEMKNWIDKSKGNSK